MPLKDQKRAVAPMSAVGKTPDRPELWEMMGMASANKSRKIYIRRKVKDYVERFLDMSVPFSAHSYPDKMYPVIKGCRNYMNKDVLPEGVKWTKTTTQHVIQAVFLDTRRNEGSRKKEEAKRKAKRELAVSLETRISKFSSLVF